MATLRVRIVLLVAVVTTSFDIINGLPRHLTKHNKSHKKTAAVAATSRSYIDIDASDPFKVPKSSQYIDQPVPEFAHRGGEKGDSAVVDVDEEENNEPPPKAFDNIQDDLKHLGLENSNEESRFKGNNDAPDDSNHDEPPANVDQENSSNDQAKPQDNLEDNNNEQSAKEAGENAQSRQNVPHDEDEPFGDGSEEQNN